MSFNKSFTSAIADQPLKDTSPSYSANSIDWAKIAVHALIVGGSAILVFAGEEIKVLDLGPYTALLVPLISSGAVWLQKWLKNNDPIK